MNKVERQDFIKHMVQENRIGRQADIQAILENNGIFVTQTTLSRDLREIGLVKVYENGQSFYAITEDERERSFTQLLADYAYKVQRASFILVLHSDLGEAALMANIIDAEKPETILGTVAGADTLLVICRDEAAAQVVEEEINRFLQE
ncbi:arginine repressor [Streptococcus sp.]|jgi:transcriptional regulator of arginine metabolism|uniref:arginine repressor n=1 Tax=Streptococcus sp. TaxID=1306 RepID=UPI00391C9CF7